MKGGSDLRIKVTMEARSWPELHYGRIRSANNPRLQFLRNEEASGSGSPDREVGGSFPSGPMAGIWKRLHTGNPTWDSAAPTGSGSHPPFGNVCFPPPGA